MVKQSFKHTGNTHIFLCVHKKHIKVTVLMYLYIYIYIFNMCIYMEIIHFIVYLCDTWFFDNNNMFNHECNISPFFQNPWEIDLSPNDPFQSVQETKAQNHQEQQYKEGHQVIAPNFETEKQVAKNGTSKKTKHINQVLHMFNYLEPKWPMFWMEFGPSFGEFKAQNRGRSQVPNICQVKAGLLAE